VFVFSIQRFIVVFFPFKKHDLCNKSKTKLQILILLIFGLLFYSFTLFSTGTNEKHHTTCATKENWLDIVKYIVFIDTIQNILLPFVLISILNVLIGVKLMKKQNSSSHKLPRKRSKLRLRNFSQSRSNTMSLEQDDDAHVCLETTSEICELKRNRRSFQNNKETNNMLLLIASVLLVLNFPITLNKTYNFFMSTKSPLNEIYTDSFTQSANASNSTLEFETGNDRVNMTNHSFEIDAAIKEMNSLQLKELLSKLAIYIYYVNFAVNFFLYTFNTKQFRENFLLFFKRNRPRQSTF
jgi:hypothetical protein